MTELPQATSRRELREWEAAARAKQSSPRISLIALPVAPPITSRPAAQPTAQPAPAARTARSTRPTNRHGVVSKLLSVGAMLFAGALAVGMSVPANAFSAASGTAQASSSVVNTSGDDGATSDGAAGAVNEADIQSATVAADQTIDTGTRDSFQVLSWAQVLAATYATITDYKYAGGKGSVRWPFIGRAPMSSPYGLRAPLCASCTSSFHSGTDFLPGVGAPIFAIADGVVTDHTEGVTDLGNNVTITHRIGKDTVTSTYGHMQAGSSPLVVGQAIHVGDFVGLVGQTGEATGPHLHLGITVNGVGTDPVPWMEAHVN